MNDKDNYICNMKHGKLIRLTDNGEQSVGNFQLFDESGNVLFTCNTLEKPWKQNERGVSCIPAGTYQVKWGHMNKANVDRYELQSVPGRSAIFIHTGNYVTEIRGCLLFGEWDGFVLSASRITVTKFETILQKEDFEIVISNEGLTQAIV